MKNIGLHFGSVYTTVSTLKTNDEPVCLDLDKPAEQKFLACHVPSAITYNGSTDPVIGSAAIAAAMEDNKRMFSDDFRHMLFAQAQDPVHANWIHRTSPFEMSRDFLTALFARLQAKEGAWDSLVCAVPDKYPAGSLGHISMLRTLRNILCVQLGQAVTKYCSESACILASHLPSNKHLDGKTVLIVNMGGRTFTAALCHYDKPHIHVLKTVYGTFGSRDFDEELISRFAETVDPRYHEYFVNYQRVKNTEASNESLLSVAEKFDLDQREEPKHFQYPAFFGLNDPSISYSDLVDVTRGFIPRFRETLHPLDVMQGNAIDNIILAGGFACNPFVEQALYKALDIKPGSFPRLTDTTKLRAVAEGAALIANNVVTTEPAHTATIGFYSGQKGERTI